MSWIKEKNNSVVLTIHVVPGASRTEIVGPYGDTLKIRLNSPPVDGKANEELLNFLAKKLEVSKLDITIITGRTKSNKVIEIKNCNLTKVLRMEY